MENKPASPRLGYVISQRWKPGAIERRDSETGFYEAVNSHALTSSEILTQQALLAKVDDDSNERIEQAKYAKRVDGHAQAFIPCEATQ